MKILFTPKTASFNFENPVFEYKDCAPNIGLPFMNIESVSVKGDLNSSEVQEFLNSIYYLELTNDDLNNAYYFLNHRGYIKVIEGTENTTKTIPPATFWTPYPKVKLYLTEEEKTLGLQYTKKVLKWAIETRATKQKIQYSGEQNFNVSEYEATVNTVLSELDSFTDGKQVRVFAHNRLGLPATVELIEEFNLSTPTLLI